MNTKKRSNDNKAIARDSKKAKKVLADGNCSKKLKQFVNRKHEKEDIIIDGKLSVLSQTDMLDAVVDDHTGIPSSSNHSALESNLIFPIEKTIKDSQYISINAANISSK